MQISGAKIIALELLHHNITDVFGLNGGNVIDIICALCENNINFHTASHEQGAAHAADGYARVSGKTGVVIATSGPGAANLVTGIAAAYCDCVPLIAITGNVPTEFLGRDNFQEIDTVGITMPITKHNFIVKKPEELQEVIREAFFIANSGKKGPVLIDIPKNVQKSVCGYDALKKFDFASGKKTVDYTNAEKLIKNSLKPLIYAGGGALLCGKEIIKLSQKLNAPVICSLMGKTAVPNSFENFLGMAGQNGCYAALKALSECDLLIALGTRFSDRATGGKKKFVNENCKVLHVDIDITEKNKAVPADEFVNCDVLDFLNHVVGRDGPGATHAGVVKRLSWLNCAKALKNAPENIPKMPAKGFNPRFIIKTLNDFLTADTVITTDVGQHQIWAAQFYNFSEPETFITSGGLGAMGFGLGAATGACIAKNKRKTVLITGDGSFHMNMNELAAAVSEELPILIILFDNKSFGMVRQLIFPSAEGNCVVGRDDPGATQSGRLINNIDINRKTNYIKLMQAFSAKGFNAENKEQFIKALKASLKLNTPCLIRCAVDKNEAVYPAGNDYN